jgi:hypothetical protein
MDAADIAQEVADRDLAIALATGRKDTLKVEPQGFCQNPNCTLIFEDPFTERLYCDADCAKEHEIVCKR